MRVGTKSILFGVHNMFLHPLSVAISWWRLYGFPRDPRLWCAFAVHDLGYFAKNSMEGPEGETHVELGARIMGICFGTKWGNFCRRHSRYYARTHGLRISRLCVADKLAFALTPAWLYLPMARASGELWEYVERSKDRQAGSEYFTSEEWSQINSGDPRAWLKGVQSYTHRWVLKHRDIDDDFLVLRPRCQTALVDPIPCETRRLSPAKPMTTVYHLRRLGPSITQILRDGFDPLPFRPELTGLGASHFEWGYGGSGPEVTAICLLRDFFEDDSLAASLCDAFKEGVIAKLPRCTTWLTAAEIMEGLEGLPRQANTWSVATGSQEALRNTNRMQ
ncbi:MAG: hypothetical protein K2X03_02435 [Bryobacteraceae bacterium]|nr:hypothetical protein [Bryobacteraceae bacterium]